jgi:chemotaxis signal transduction protein
VTEATSEVLMFQVGPRVFAAVVYDAVRIGSVREVPADDLVVSTDLGPPFARERGIVVTCHEDGVERMLVIDRIIGVRSVPEADVHPLPAFAAACIGSGAVTGFVMLDDAPMLLVDLPTLIRERQPAAPRESLSVRA